MNFFAILGTSSLVDANLVNQISASLLMDRHWRNLNQHILLRFSVFSFKKRCNFIDIILRVVFVLITLNMKNFSFNLLDSRHMIIGIITEWFELNDINKFFSQKKVNFQTDVGSVSPNLKLYLANSSQGAHVKLNKLS